MKKQHSIGKTILILRIGREWTRSMLAKKLNVSDETIFEWETDKESPSDDMLSQLSKIFNVSIDCLLTGTIYSEIPLNLLSNFKYEEIDLGYIIMRAKNTRLTKAIIPHGVYRINYNAFQNCKSLTSVTIPDSVISIDSCAFQNCESLTSVTIPDSVIYISNAAFWHCVSLKTVTIGNNVTTIGDFVFSDCTSLETVTIGNNVTSIGINAFQYCSSLTSVIIPDSVISIGNSAFFCCNSLDSIIVDDNNPNYSSIDGNLYNKDGTELICYAIGKANASFVIPNSVTSIGRYAIVDCRSLTSVTIPDSVISIGGGTFSYCASLATVTIGNNVTSIGDGVFSGCESLKFIFYKGTAEEWNKISIDPNNRWLNKITKYFYSETKPTEKGKYWHYVDGVPTRW